MTGYPLHSRGKTTCALRAFGVVRASADTLPALRQQPGPRDGLAIPSNLLKHADDQMVVALAAVLHAVRDNQLLQESFADWAVVAAPRYPGRVPFANALDRYFRMGSLSVSPIIVPYLSMHSVSSMISLALGIHGPSIGAGGGDAEFTQALLTGLAFQQERDLPGVWVVVAGWDPEPVLSVEAANGPPPVCHAAALALMPETPGARGSRLRLVPRVAGDTIAAPSLFDLIRFLTVGTTIDQPRTWSCPINDCNLEVTVESVEQLSLLAKSA